MRALENFFNFAVFLILNLAFSQSLLASIKINKNQSHQTHLEKHQIIPGLTTYSKVLKNNLTVVLTPNLNAPLTSIFHWVKAGSLHETPGITGIAHLFEHMMFRPLKKGVPGFFELIRNAGADANASTRYESTVFTTTTPHSELLHVLQLESDRFQKLKVSSELLAIEKEAVRSEYSSKIDTDSFMDLWMSLFKVGFINHPFGWTIIGNRGDLDTITADDCNTFFMRYYNPSNIGLFIAGNFDPEDLFLKIEAFYGEWKKGTPSALPPEYKESQVELSGNGALSSRTRNLLIGYRIPYFTSDNALDFEVLNHILIESKLSLLKRRLLFLKKNTLDIDGFNFDYDSGLLEITASLPEKTTYKQVLNELDEIPNDFKNLSQAQWFSYLDGMAISLQEELLRNKTLNENLSRYWGKYGDFRLLKKAFAPEKWVSKHHVSDWIEKIWQPSNRIWVHHKELTNEKY